MLENDADSIKRAGDIAKSIEIPPQPGIVIKVNEEVRQADPDLKKLTDLVNKDVALAAKALKIVNSSFFGLRQPAKSISQAISLLGLNNFSRIVVASSLEESLNFKGLDKEAMARFWRHSLLVASVSDLIARKVYSSSPTPAEFKHLLDHAYTLGLFHDCAIPLMMKKFSDYSDCIPTALAGIWSAQQSEVHSEEMKYGASHCTIGYIVAKSWRLDPDICECIKHHHDHHVSDHDDLNKRRLLANLLLAECTVEILTEGISSEIEDNLSALPEELIFELDLGKDDIANIREKISAIVDEPD